MLIHPALERHDIDPAFRARHRLHDMRPGAPGGVAGDAAAIDRPIAEEPCPDCGCAREFRPFIHAEFGAQRHLGGRYRAFSVCPVCGSEMEF